MIKLAEDIMSYAKVSLVSHTGLLAYLNKMYGIDE